MADEMDLHASDIHDEARHGMERHDDERLPWLETVEGDEPVHRPWGRIVSGVVLAMLALVALLFGIHRYQQQDASGNGQLIAAQEGDYKVKPNDPGGLKVEGEGTSAIATSNGKSAGSGAIDLKAVPEVPVAGHHPAAASSHAAATPAGRNAVAQVPASGGKLVAAAPVGAAHGATAASHSGGSLVQLGAFPSEAAANAVWGGFGKRFAYLAPLGKSVQPVAIGGHTLYRLRVNAGSANQAADICGRLKVAGEACFIVS